MMMGPQFMEQTAGNTKESEISVSVNLSIKKELEKEAQHNLSSFPVDELEATVKVENCSSGANDDLLSAAPAHMVKSEFIEFHKNQNSDELNQTDMQTVTLEKIPKTEAKILGDEPPFSSDEEDSNYRNDIQSDSGPESDPERDPFADIDCDPCFSQAPQTHTCNSFATQDDVINGADVKDSSNSKASSSSANQKILPTPTTYLQLTSTLQCQLCRKIQSSKKELKIHLKSCAVPPTDQKGHRRFCVLCNKLYSFASDYRKHALRVHGIQELHSKPFKCNICGRAFLHQRSLIAHSGLHQQKGDAGASKDFLVDKPFKCPECPSGFAYISGLISHSKLHKTEPPFKCLLPNCGCSFVDNRSLNAHLNSAHFDGHPLTSTCPKPNCGKTFKSDRYMKDHFRSVHTRPFKCREPGCSGAFPRNHLLSFHVQAKHRNIKGKKKK